MDRRIRLAGWLLFVLCLAWCVWIVVSAIITSQTTGILYIKSADPKANLIVSQNNREAIGVGSGTAKVRLKPGSYQVSALDDGKQANGTVKVYKKSTASVSLNPVQSVMLPSVATVNFEGMNALINNGLTTTQITNLEQAFFQYKPRAQTVSIAAGSVVPEPHNPNSDTPFTIDFDVSIDATSYKATISYSGLNTIELFLYNPQNNTLLFDSGS